MSRMHLAVAAMVTVVTSGICRADAGGDWLSVGAQLAQTERAAEAPAAPAGAAYVPWQERRGPAYPGDFWHSFGRDAKELPATLWDDTKVTFTSPTSWILFGLAGAAGIALHGNNGDDQVADHYTRHGSQLNTFWDSVGDAGGNPGTHFALAGAAYLCSLAKGDTKTYEVSKTLLNALIINGLFTEALKVAARTESPNGDEMGWPSGHASSSFCFATVMHEAYGPWVGVPLFGFATFVGYERIDARNHDFSDVISGALIGIAVGHAVSTHHQPRILGMDVIPYVNPEKGALGIALTKTW
ncbi:MAG: phosphatase PAP2 family protein [Phycisphaerae bacterium]|nr:phosphatase PAP2 family protein [Phycisphaerae bacterium]